MLQTVATVPAPRMIELLELIELANRHDAEPRLHEFLHHCRRTGYEPPIELLDLARDHIQRKPVRRVCQG
ncbi:MAG TPA: hypothetical protein PKI41_02855 [Candidatus Competibacteraceae bacterium]|nr:MAG: hypothetical protein EKK71_08665 [Candidatus Competibacteraceae bacterium]HOB61038.1 hypothetical protein [Candidatus Competibacteraceae bacterium]HQA25810.1 hypothetical protein [Candidatus Competibacteraceae bacterium]HQD55825.1 hypothetical protein [Candidatus Competibacteraceae bacterium]